MAQLLNQTNAQPQMRAAFAGWMSNITMQVIRQTVVNDGLIKNQPTPITFQGTVQPLSAKALMLKDEGQRAFQWLQIHCQGSTVILNDNDRIVYNGQTYKVMGKWDYTQNNFIEYHAIEDFKYVATAGTNNC